MLFSRRLLGLRRLVQDAELGRFVLQHALLGLDACLQVENRLLILSPRDGIDQLLNRLKAVTCR